MNKNLKYILIFIFLNNIISVKFKENGLKILKHIDNNAIKYQYLFALGIPLFNKYFLKKIKKNKKNNQEFKNNIIDENSQYKVNKFSSFLINYAKKDKIKEFCNESDYLKTLLIVNNGNKEEQEEIVKNLKENVEYSIDIDIDLILEKKLEKVITNGYKTFINEFNPEDLNLLIQEKLDKLRQEKLKDPNFQSILYIKNLQKVICNRDEEYEKKDVEYYKINTVLNLLTIIDGLKYEKDGITLIISLDYEYENIVDPALFRFGRFFEKVYILKKENNYEEVLQKKTIDEKIEKLKKTYLGKNKLKYIELIVVNNPLHVESKEISTNIYDDFITKIINYSFNSYEKDIKYLNDYKKKFIENEKNNKEELIKFDNFIKEFEDIIKDKTNLFIIEKYKKKKFN